MLRPVRRKAIGHLSPPGMRPCAAMRLIALGSPARRDSSPRALCHRIRGSRCGRRTGLTHCVCSVTPVLHSGSRRRRFPLDIYEWVHLFEALLRLDRIDVLDYRNLPAGDDSEWTRLARRRLELDRRRRTTEENLTRPLLELIEAYDRAGLPYERGLTRLSLARHSQSSGGQAEAATSAAKAALSKSAGRIEYADCGRRYDTVVLSERESTVGMRGRGRGSAARRPDLMRVRRGYVRFTWRRASLACLLRGQTEDVFRLSEEGASWEARRRDRKRLLGQSPWLY